MRSAAEEAARSVVTIFSGRLLGVPGTNLCAMQRPGAPWRPWHYWWQAHFVDCVVDALQRGSTAVAPKLVDSQLRGIWLRQGLSWRNHYYDDMAWLALAALRAGRRLPRLEPVLRSAITDDWGGGAFWHTVRDFKNTPATAPIALLLARLGDHETARALTAWLVEHLSDQDSGLLLDGMRLDVKGELALERALYTYNQGPILGVWLELGDTDSLARVESLVKATAQRLTLGDTLILRTHGDGDGGLFTGILVRYLALVAHDPRISAQTRELASDLVNATAQNLWDGRVSRGWRHVPVTCFPQDTALSHGELGERVELSTQLQAWMCLEAASRTPSAG